MVNLLNFRPFQSKSKPKTPPPPPSILSVPFTSYDPQSGLPTSIRIGVMEISPLVSIQELRDHLTILSAFYKLRQSAESYEDLCHESAVEYAYWAQVTLSGLDKVQVDLDLPSLGVLMCWHAHMLNPRVFDEECEGAYQSLRGRVYPLGHIARAIRDNTLPKSSPPPNHSWNAETTVWTPQEIGEAVARQGKFVGNMNEIGWYAAGFTGSHDGEMCLKRGIVRYHAWLDLMHAHQSKHFLVPTLDIDLAWHTHQLKGSVYKADTLRLLEDFLDHNDNAGEGRLGDGLGLTSKLWKERFGFEYTY